MNKKFLTIYKVPLLISLTLGIVLVSVDLTREPIQIATIFLASLLGTFFLDLEYVIYAFLMEPNKDFSKTFRSFIKHYDFSNAAQYIEIHKNEIKDKTLNSALFQVILAIFAIFVVSSSTQLFTRALVVSVLANSIYKLIEARYEGRLEDWFWALKEKPNQQGVVIYIGCLLMAMVYCVSSF